MWSRESPMKEYARKHPGCSLQEYCEYLDNIAREEAERRRLKEEENNQLLKSFEGKCFQINFNRQSFGYFKITKDITALREDVKEDFYEVFIDSNTTRISLEKNFSESDSTILQIMDGVYNSKYRKVFLLTTNAMSINENMVGRPSRIRYVKKFENLDLKVVNEYLDDALEVPEARQDLLDFIDSLTISTIDILKTIVNEVNIHGIEGLRKAKSFFNVVTNEYEYSCIRGYAYTGEIEQDKNKFSIENFSKAVERFNNPIPKPIVNDEDNCTMEERKALNEYYEYRRHNFHNLSYYFIYSSTKFSNLKVGDGFYSDEIIAIDKKLN